MFMFSSEEALHEDNIDQETPVKMDKCQIGHTASTFDLRDPKEKSLPLNAKSLVENQSFNDDLPLDQKLIQDNAVLLHRACEEFVESFEVFNYGSNKNLQNARFFHSQQDSQNNQSCSLQENLINRNPLLSSTARNTLKTLLTQFEQLRFLVHEINENNNDAKAHEILFILFSILEDKLQDFEKLKADYSKTVIPMMPRFWGDQNQETIEEGCWQPFPDFDYETVRKFSSAKIDKISSNLIRSRALKYFASQKSQVEFDYRSKLTAFLSFVAENLFLSLSCISQPDSALQEYTYNLYLSQEEVVFEGHRGSKKVKLG